MCIRDSCNTDSFLRYTQRSAWQGPLYDRYIDWVTRVLQDLSYKDRHWHEKCFKCCDCQVSLVDHPFASKNDKLYCADCHDNNFAARCDGCGGLFRAGMYTPCSIMLWFFAVCYDVLSTLFSFIYSRALCSVVSVFPLKSLFLFVLCLWTAPNVRVFNNLFRFTRIRPIHRYFSVSQLSSCQLLFALCPVFSSVFMLVITFCSLCLFVSVVCDVWYAN